MLVLPELENDNKCKRRKICGRTAIEEARDATRITIFKGSKSSASTKGFATGGNTWAAEVALPTLKGANTTRERPMEELSTIKLKKVFSTTFSSKWQERALWPAAAGRDTWRQRDSRREVMFAEEWWHQLATSGRVLPECISTRASAAWGESKRATTAARTGCRPNLDTALTPAKACIDLLRKVSERRPSYKRRRKLAAF